jgi:hypothetical protein
LFWPDRSCNWCWFHFATMICSNWGISCGLACFFWLFGVGFLG